MADCASTSHPNGYSELSSALASSSIELKSRNSRGHMVKRKSETAFNRQRRRPLQICSLDHLVPHGRFDTIPQSDCVSRFLDLAPELRNRIYNYALQGGSAGWTGRARYNYTDGNDPYRTACLYCPRGANTRLMRCCRQIYQETKAMIYELNVFNLAVRMLSSLQTIVSLQEPFEAWTCWKNIKHLQIHGSVSNILDFVAPLASRQDLKIHTLRLDLNDNSAKEVWQLGQLKVHGFVKITLRRSSTIDQAAFIANLKSLLGEIIPNTDSKRTVDYSITQERFLRWSASARACAISTGR